MKELKMCYRWNVNLGRLEARRFRSPPWSYRHTTARDAVLSAIEEAGWRIVMAQEEVRAMRTALADLNATARKDRPAARTRSPAPKSKRRR